MATSDREAPVLSCASYTHARRHPMVLGKIGGWSPPIQLSAAQIIVLVAGYATLAWTWELWARGPGALNFVVMAVGPWVPTWALRAVRIEGRDVLRTGLGLAAYASAPRRGCRAGRPVRAARPRAATGQRVFITREDS
jgi:hypothetical protein